MRRRAVLVVAAFVAVCAAAALAGGYLAVRAFAGTVEPFTLGTARVTVVPALDGRVDVYVPIVDWGVRAEPYAAPVAFELRFRSLDRDEARDALRSGPAARERLESIRGDLARLGRRALARAAVLGVVGACLGGLLAGGVIGALLHRRRWLAYGAGVGLVVTLAYAALVAATLRTVDYDAFERPTFYAHGRELPRLLSFSDQLLTAGENYTQSYEEALAGLANLVVFAGERGGPGERPATTVVLASDLHANALVLPVLEDYTREQTVFLAGDVALLGAELESRLVPALSTLGTQVVAVSGNHDSAPLMLDLAGAGVVVLTREGRLRDDGSTDGNAVVVVDGLAVAGYDDPLEGASALAEGRPLELTTEQLAEEERAFVAWFDGLPRRPDVVVVHQHALAHALLDAVAPGDPPLAILTGHDHEQHVEQNEAATLVDGGTVGAGGPFAIGEQNVGFAEVHFTDDGVARTVDLIEVEPLSGNAQARRLALGPVAPQRPSAGPEQTETTCRSPAGDAGEHFVR
jgi:predicted phosphodiesterase